MKFLEDGSESGFFLESGRTVGALKRVGDVEPCVILVLKDSAKEFSRTVGDDNLGDCTRRFLSIRLLSCTPHVLSTKLPAGATCKGVSSPET